MLTSKEVLERTGISRATLNNYISSGLLPRPDVLPPSEGAAPRMGHFPDDTVERIAEIQRLKSQGWSIGRIAQHFAGGSAPMPVAPSASSRPPLAVAAAFQRPAVPAVPIAPSLADVPPAAYTVGPALELSWLSERARFGPPAGWIAWPPQPNAGDSVMRMLLAAPAGAARDSLLAFHVQVARQRGMALAQLTVGLAAQDAALVQARFDDALVVDPGAVLRTVFPTGSPGSPDWAAYAVPMDRGTLFLYAPAAESAPAGVVATGAAARAAGTPPTPELADVAVLVTELQDARRLWRQLPAPEYFELMHEVWLAVEPVLLACGAVLGRHPGEGMVAYFLARNDRDHLLHALDAALQVREAMRQVSRDWQQRKGWALQLCLNAGVADGQEWIGSLRPGAPDEWTVLGDAAEQAALMARLGRGGAVWATRSLVGKLPREQRAGLQYGAPRGSADPGAPVVLSSFARLQDVAGPGDRLPHEFADLAVAEVIALASPLTGLASPGGRSRPA